MTDLFTWSIDLGRWFGTRVRIHLFLVIYAAFWLLSASFDADHNLAAAAGTLGLLALALIVHELGHAAMAMRLGVDRDEVLIWPLGDLVPPTTSQAIRTPESVAVSLAGPVASLAVAISIGIGLLIGGFRMQINPFGTQGGTPSLADGHLVGSFSAAWWLGRFGFLNLILGAANLIPALPMDMGRVFRGVLAIRSKDSMIAPYTGRAIAVLFGLVGIWNLFNSKPGAFAWLGLAVVFWVLVRAELMMLEDSGFFEEGGIFGYDFSQGYTSLEAQAPKVRPHRESALKRWRRRRSEQRRQRREAQEAAEINRMDEILLKIHESGRGSLTDEEQRFLARVSAKIRTKRGQRP